MSTPRSKKTQKRFWLRIPANFFEHGPMLLLERSENHLRLQTIWMRILTFCLKGNPNESDAGILRLSEKFAYDEKTLAAALRVDLFDFRVAFKTFLDFEMVEVGEDDTIYVGSIQTLIGSETDAAERMRALRERRRTLPGASVTKLSKSSESVRTEEKRSVSVTSPTQGVATEAPQDLNEEEIQELERFLEDIKKRRA